MGSIITPVAPGWRTVEGGAIPRAWRRITDSQDSAISPKRRDLAQSPPMERAATSRTLTRFRPMRNSAWIGPSFRPRAVTARRVR